jgi:tetratricopeptide (TPR) repeat protein
VFSEAYAAHQAGRLDQAERDYRSVLRSQPEHIDALHLLGVLQHQRGRHSEAIELIGRAASLRPRDAGIQLNLGNAFKASGRLDDAIERYRDALDADPGFVPAHFNLGNAYAQASRYTDAVHSFTNTLRFEPGHAAAHNNLGNALNAMGRHAEAIEAFDAVLRLQPGHAGALNNKATALNALARPDEALQSLHAALIAQPSFVTAHLNLANTFEALERSDEAIAAFDRALALAPALAPAHYGRGLALSGLRRHAEAVPSLERAVGLEPGLALAWLALGNAHHAIANPDGALRAFDQALRIRPDLAAAHYNRALTRLSQGDFRKGLKDYEWRLRSSVDVAEFTAPRWHRDQPLEGRTLLIWAEQGFGDTLQFVRWMPLLIARAGREAQIVLEVQAPLSRLLRPLADAAGIQLIAQGDTRPRYDRHCPLMSLPLELDIDLSAVTAGKPYLAPAKAESARAPTKAAERRRIGLVWSGKVQGRSDDRSVPLATLKPLLELNSIEWVALQPKCLPADRQWLSRHASAHLSMPLGETADFTETAGLIAGLEAVVTIDSAVAHLAGAMGCPTWVMLPRIPDWRWFPRIGRSRWYDSLTLLRSTTQGDWAGVVEQVRTALLGTSSDRRV